MPVSIRRQQVAIGVAECRNRAAAYVVFDGDGFAGSLVDKGNLWRAQKHRLAFAQLERGLASAANDVFGRNPVDLLSLMAHEIDAATRDDEGLEAACLKVG